MVVRSATYQDSDAIISIDPIGAAQRERVNFIHRVIASRTCYVAEMDRNVVGYAVLEYTFFEHGLVRVLAVHPRFHRKGVGSMLMRHLEQTCKTPKLFITTGRGNAAMQKLLKKLGYKRSGTIENLDEGEPELVYVKKLN